MITMTLKLPGGLHARLSAAARKIGTSKSEVARQALEAFLEDARRHRHRVGSCLDMAKDLAGSVKGPGDLSFNKRYLKDYGK